MNTEQHGPAHRLEMIIRIMEQILWYCHWAYTSTAGRFKGFNAMQANTIASQQIFGAVKNYKEIRPRIISTKEIGANEFTMSQLVSDGEFGGKGQFYAELPWFTQRWCWASRKVFTLSPELQQSLELASVGQLKWQDVTFPFPSFLVKLPIPITIGTEGYQQPSDTLLVCREPNMLYLLLIGNDTDKHRPFSPEWMRLVEEYVRKGRPNKAYRLLKNLPKECLWSPSVTLFTSPVQLDVPIADILGMKIDATITGGPNQKSASEAMADTILRRKSVPEVHQIKTPENAALALRIAIGLCLHLTSLKPEEEKRLVTRTGQHVQKWNAVTDGADICHVESAEKLNALEHEIHKRIREVGIRKALEELGIHGRTAYWRRKPGYGNDPNAPFCVKVRWTIVGLDYLPEGALPISREAIVEMFKK